MGDGLQRALAFFSGLGKEVLDLGWGRGQTPAFTPVIWLTSQY